MEFFYGKLVYHSHLQQPLTSKKDLMLGVLNNKATVSYRGKPFMFIDIEAIDIGESSYIIGKLVKYNDTEEITIDVEEHKTKTVTVPDKIIAQSIFVIDFEENYVLYTEVKNHISRTSFIERFNNLVYLGLGDTFFNVTLNSIHDTYTFYNKLMSLSKVLELELKISPTNPNADDIIKTIDERLKIQNVKQKTIKYSARDGGLNIDDEMKDNSVYTDLGYGVGYAEGEDKNGRKVKVYSKKSDKQRKTPKIESEDGAYGIIEQIDELLKKQKNEK